MSSQKKYVVNNINDDDDELLADPNLGSGNVNQQQPQAENSGIGRLTAQALKELDSAGRPRVAGRVKPAEKKTGDDDLSSVGNVRGSGSDEDRFEASDKNNNNVIQGKTIIGRKNDSVDGSPSSVNKNNKKEFTTYENMNGNNNNHNNNNGTSTTPGKLMQGTAANALNGMRGSEKNDFNVHHVVAGNNNNNNNNHTNKANDAKPNLSSPTDKNANNKPTSPNSSSPASNQKSTKAGVESGSAKQAQRQPQQRASQMLDDDDDGRLSHKSGSSAGISNIDSANETGEERSKLYHVIYDVLTKSEEYQQQVNRGDRTPQNSPGNGFITKSQLFGQDSGAISPAVQKLRTAHARSKMAEMQEVALFSQLDQKSARALVIADPLASEIVWVNEAAERLFGRLDLIGSKLESLMPEEIAVRHAGIIASYRERYAAEFKKSGSPPESRLLDIVKARRFTIVRKFNGRDEPCQIDAWVRTLRLQDEPLGEMPRLMALEAFEAQKYHDDSADARIFKAALENVSDAIVIADFSGRIEYMNKSAELLCGYPLSAITAIRASVNTLVPLEMVAQHEGFLQHFRQNRRAAAVAMNVSSQEIVVQRRTEMRTAFGKEEILLRVEVAYDKLIGFLKSTREFIPREDFDNERLKLLLPASIVKLLRGATNVSDITSFFWEFDHKTVMFTDVAGFSNWARNRPVKTVHDRMQPMFSEFEAIVQAFGGELIHRIGDAIMVIFGFNGEERHHARYALACAVELQQWSLNNGFLVRIGLHSGAIGAGIYGSDKGRPSFDAWGPVVNVAKRLEAYGDEGNVHFSKQTNIALGHRFASQLHQILRVNNLEGIKGIEDGEQSFILNIKASDSNQVVLPEKFMQLVGFQKAKFARWRIANEETERRLAELQKAAR